MHTVEDSCCSRCASPLLCHPFYSNGKESHHPSPSDCLTRSSISDTQLCHPEQSLFSDREAGTLTAPRRLERGDMLPVPEGFISCPDRSFLFQVGRWIFFPSWSTVPASSEKTLCYFNMSLTSHLWSVLQVNLSSGVRILLKPRQKPIPLYNLQKYCVDPFIDRDKWVLLYFMFRVSQPFKKTNKINTK